MQKSSFKKKKRVFVDKKIRRRTKTVSILIFNIIFSTSIFVMFLLSFLGVMYWNAVLEYVQDFPVQAVAIGGVTALAYYLNSLGEGVKIQTRTAAIRTATGMVMGPIGSQLAMGADMNSHFQIASAAVAGAKGPELMSKLSEKLSEKL